MPERIQRQRTKGWRMPAGAVYVGRPTKWGNPFKVTGGGAVNDRASSVGLFRRYRPDEAYLEVVRELRGTDLACWCPLDQPCHADVLLEWANS